MNPVLTEVFGFSIRYYGLLYALAIVLIYQLLKRDLKWSGLKITEDELFNLIIYTFFGGIIGARLYFVALSLPKYTSSTVPWWEFLAIWHGGLAIHGGIILGPLTLLFFCKSGKLPFWNVADLFAAHLLLGQAIGRIGNLMNGDAHGLPTDMPWGLVFPYGPAAYDSPGVPLHPVMLYESAMCIIGWLILYQLRDKGFKPGFISMMYIVFYSIIRYVSSQFRADDLLILGMKAPFLISLVGFGVATALILFLNLYHRPHKEERQHYRIKAKWKP